MKLKTKLDEQRHKEVAQRKLAARLAILETRGAEQKTITKDTLVKKLKAQIRRTERRLKQAVIQDKISAENLKRKEEKAIAEKEAKAARINSRKKRTSKTAKKEKKTSVKKELAIEEE